MSPTIFNDSVAIYSDIHCPLTDWDFLAYANGHCRKRRIRTLILAGDFLNGDSVSDYPKKQADASLIPEIRTANEAMDELCEQFDDVHFIKGNHDYRYVKKMGYAGSFVDTMRMLGFDNKNLTIYEDDHIWVEGGYGSTYVCHPTSYSRIPLTNCRNLTYKTRSHVVAGHCHHSAFGYAPDGKSVLIEAGGFFDMDKTEYIRASTPYPRWVNGFATIENGKHYLITKQGAVS